MVKKIILVLAVLALTIPVFAKNWEYKQAGYTFWLPDNWKTQNMEGGILFANDPSEEISVFFMVSAASNLEEAGKAIDKELDSFLKDIKTEEGKNENINGLQVFYVDGKGKTKEDGVDVDFSVAFYVKPGDKKILMLFIMAPSELAEKHQKNVEKIVKSVKKKK